MQLELIGAQLSLSGQMETMKFIKEFIDFISEHNYNFLLLYLEDRVKTPGYPYPANNESYTLDEMREIVEYAEKKEIEVIPCVSPLGHARRFLRHKEMEELAELQNGKSGRFGNTTKTDFCPSKEALYDFFSEYFKELSQVFTSQYFHLGHDEVWDIGYCEDCAPQAAAFDGEQRLFLKSIMRFQEMLKRLGKRMMIWDDMFESYPDILSEIPRDVIMVNWEYQDDMRFCKEHFGNMKPSFTIEKYEKLGFEYIIAASDFSISNIRSFTEYALNYKPLGGLVTCWGKSNIFLYRSFPAFAYAGELWSGLNHDKSFARAIDSIFGECDEVFFSALYAAAENKLLFYNPAKIEKTILTYYFMGPEVYPAALNEVLEKNLSSNLAKMVRKRASDVLCDMIYAVRLNNIILRIKDVFLNFYRYGFSPKYDAKLLELLGKLEENGIAQVNFWNEKRKNIQPCNIADYYKKLVTDIKQIRADIERGCFLKVRFCLPNQFGAAKCAISFRENDEWRKISSGIFKANEASRETVFERIFPVERCCPDSIRFDVSGFGGTGICYTEIKMLQEIFIPAKVELTEGLVIFPESVLEDDCRWAYIGEQDSKAPFRDKTKEKVVNSLQIKLDKKKRIL